MIHVFLGIGIVCIIFSGIFLGVWAEGPQERANFHSETAGHRNFRITFALYTGLAGILCIAVAGLLYLF